MNVDILDIGSGNIRSIKNWIEQANVRARIVSMPRDLKSELLILPGVGSAGSYMQRLKAGQYDEAVHEHVANGGRLLGICLGFQIMGHYSEEDGHVDGLGLIEAYTERLSSKASHNGWEPIHLRKNQMKRQSFHSQHRQTRKNVLNGRVFYNHQYGVVNQDTDAFTIPVSKSLHEYSGLLIKDKIIGFQFHPEKSQISGLELIAMML